LAFFGSETLRSSSSAFQSPRSSFTDGLPLGLAYGVLSFTNRNVENLLGKLNGIARTFGHETEYATLRAAVTGYENSN
jgi:hypothetical protein